MRRFLLAAALVAPLFAGGCEGESELPDEGAPYLEREPTNTLAPPPPGVEQNPALPDPEDPTATE